MSKPRKLHQAELERLADDSEAIGKAQRLAPTWSDIQSAFPEARIVDHPDGKRTCHIEDHAPGKPRLRLLNEMFKPKCRLDAELGQKRHARTPEVVMRDRSGALRYVKEAQQERVERKLGARRVRVPRFSGLDSWKDRDGRWWVKEPGEREWRLAHG